MLFQCPRVQVNFPAEKLCLVNPDQARLVWDEHGGTFVLRVEGLEVLESPELGGEAEVRLEVALPEAEALTQRIEEFAGRHSLRLGSATSRAEFTEAPLLAACHLPGKNLFIFCEDPRLAVRLKRAHCLELMVKGAFRSRRVPCQETDLVIHLDPAAMSRLLAGLLAWAREGT
jgi:hypothetical protein